MSAAPVLAETVARAVRLVASPSAALQEVGLRRLVNLCLRREARDLFDSAPQTLELLAARAAESAGEVVRMLSLWLFSHIALEPRRAAAIDARVLRAARSSLAAENADVAEKALWLLHNVSRDETGAGLRALCGDDEESLVALLVGVLADSPPQLQTVALNTLQNVVVAAPAAADVAAKNQSRFCRANGVRAVLNLLNDPDRQPPELILSVLALLYALANGGPETEPVLRKILVVAGALPALLPLASSEEQTRRERTLLLLVSLSQSPAPGLERPFLDTGVFSLAAESLTNAQLPRSTRVLSALILANLSVFESARAMMRFTGICSAASLLLESDDMKGTTTVVQLVSTFARDETLRLELLSAHVSERLKVLVAKAHNIQTTEASATKLLQAIDAAMAIIYTPVSAEKKQEVMDAALARLTQLQDASEEAAASPSPRPQFRGFHRHAATEAGTASSSGSSSSCSASPSPSQSSLRQSSGGWTFAKVAPTERRPSLASPLSVGSPAVPQRFSPAAPDSPPPQQASCGERGTSFRAARRSVTIGSSDPELAEKLKKLAKLNGLRQKRGHIAREIYTSEKAYVHNLELCIKHYSEPLLDSDSFLEMSTVQALFNNISDIYLLNSGFLMVLDNRMKEWGTETQLGDVFSSFWKTEMERFYTQYILGLDGALELYYKLMAENSTFKDFVANVVKKVNQDLASFLVMPVQRVPRYILLLKTLLQRTPPMHPDGVALHRALQEAKQLTDRINEEKRRFESLQKVENLEKTIDGLPLGMKLVTPTRMFVRQGLLLEVDPEKCSVYRVVVMLSDIVLFATQQKKRLHVERLVSLDDIRAELKEEPVAGGSELQETVPNAFVLTTSEGSFVMAASSLEERDEWIAAFNRTPQQ